MDITRNKEILNISFPSLKDERKKIINIILEAIADHKVPVVLNHNEIYLVVDEALTNAMEHGNRWDARKKVNIRMIMNNSHLNIGIEDEGPGFDTRQVSLQTQGPNNLATRGRGIKLIRQFCKPTWNSAGNRIELIIDLKS